MAESESSQNKLSLIQLNNQQVSVKLTDENFLIWKQQVTITVRGHGLEGFLDGSSIQPSKLIPTGEDGIWKMNPEYVTWQRQDQLLASWLLSSLSESILVSMVGFNTSQEIWQSLEASFTSQTSARKMQYKIQLQNLKKGGLTMRDYLNKVKSLCDAIASVMELYSKCLV